MRIAILHTGIRVEEKLLMTAAGQQKIQAEFVDARQQILNPADLSSWQQYDVVLERCISGTRGNAIIEFLSNMDINVVNNREVMQNCNDKFQTASLLEAAGVPTAKSMLVFDEAQAKAAIEVLGGYPVVVKPRSGSWGRLISKANDADALEAILDHKKYMGPEHGATIIQEYVEKPGRDIRAFVVGNQVICAIYRTSPHWITNTARGGVAANCPVTKEIRDISLRAAKAVGGGILAMDIFETKNGLIINEINHTMEFKNSEAPTGVSISGEIIDYLQKNYNHTNKK